MVLGSNPGMDKRFFSFSKHADWQCSPPSLLFSRKWGSFPEVKQLGNEVDHSPQSSTKVKKEWSHISTPPTYLHGMGRDSFTFILPHGCVLCSLQYRVLLPVVHIKKEQMAEV
jgi:hypothetical protein